MSKVVYRTCLAHSFEGWQVNKIFFDGNEVMRTLKLRHHLTSFDDSSWLSKSKNFNRTISQNMRRSGVFRNASLENCSHFCFVFRLIYRFLTNVNWSSIGVFVQLNVKKFLILNNFFLLSFFLLLFFFYKWSNSFVTVTTNLKC